MLHAVPKRFFRSHFCERRQPLLIICMGCCAQEKSWYAVHENLLRFISDELHHGGATFASATIIWSKQQSSKLQQSRILGDDLTKSSNTADALADAWYIYNARRLAGRRGRDLKWNFTPDGLEAMLLQLAPLVRESHLERIAQHIKECPRCGGALLVLLDGKYGAHRFICSNVEGYWFDDDLQAGVHTGCMSNAGAGHFFCKKCRPAKLNQQHLIPQTEVIGITEKLDVATGRNQVFYVVKCFDPDVRLILKQPGCAS